MDTRSLELFIALAESLNFSRVAAQRNMSLSAVSRSVARMEEEVGTRLLERDRRSVRLTRAGEQFLVYAQQGVDDWQRLLGDLRPEADRLRGEISIYGSVTASYSVLSPVLEPFRARYPAIDIKLRTGDYADAMARVLEGQDDLAVAAHPESLPAKLAFLTLLHSPLCFIAPAFPCAVREQVEALDPGGEAMAWSEVPFIVTERGLSRERVNAWFRARGRKPGISAQVAGHEAVAAMVGLGLGVGVIPQLVLDNSNFRDKLDSLPVSQPPGDFAIGLCALRQRLENPLVAAFWEVAADSYRVSI